MVWFSHQSGPSGLSILCGKPGCLGSGSTGPAGLGTCVFTRRTVSPQYLGQAGPCRRKLPPSRLVPGRLVAGPAAVTLTGDLGSLRPMEVLVCDPSNLCGPHPPMLQVPGQTGRPAERRSKPCSGLPLNFASITFEKSLLMTHGMGAFSQPHQRGPLLASASEVK